MSEATRYCANCGRAVEEGAQFCGGCGHSVETATTDTPATSPPPPQPAATPPASSPPPQAAAPAQAAQSSGSGSSNVVLWVILAVVAVGIVLLLVGGLALGWFVMRRAEVTPATQATVEETQTEAATETTQPATSTASEPATGTASGSTPPPATTTAPETPAQPVKVERPSRVVVPNVIGMSSVDAERQLEATGGFRVMYNSARYSELYSRNNIISQSPKGGAIAQAGDVVYIVQSRGPSPTPTARQQPARRTTTRRTVTGSAFNGCIAPYSSQRRVRDSDMQQYSNWVLTLMRNEIYARHGRTFQNQRIRAYFNNQSWYRPTSSFRESWLNSTEKQNAARILSYQQRRYGSAATRP